MHKYSCFIYDILGSYKRYQDVINIFILVTLSAFVFHNSLDGYFLHVDDLGPEVHSARGLADIFTTNTVGGHGGGSYRPMIILSHRIDSYLYGDDRPFGRHLTNLIVHIFNAILVYKIAFYLTQKREIGLTAGLLFVANPIHARALPPVAWITGRADTVVSFFYLLTVILFIRSLSKRSSLTYFISFTTFILALLSKEMAATLPAVLLLYTLLFLDQKKTAEDCIPEHARLVQRALLLGGISLIIFGIVLNANFIANYLTSDGALGESSIRKIHFLQLCLIASGSTIVLTTPLLKLLKKPSDFKFLLSAPYFLILLFYLIASFIALETYAGSRFSTDSAGGPLTFQLGLDTFMRDIFSLLGLVWPLGVDYHRAIWALQTEHNLIFSAASGIVALCLVLVLVKLVSQSRMLTFSYLWIFITLAPVHNALITGWFFQSRYLYLSSVGFCIFISILIGKLTQRGEPFYRIPGVVAAALILLMVGLNCISVVRHNEKLVKSSDVIRRLVSDIRERGQPKISNATDFYFITFPLFSSFEPVTNVWITACIHEVIKFANNTRRYSEKNNYNFLLFMQGEENSKVETSWLDKKTFILESTGAVNYFLIPNERSFAEKEIAEIYQRSAYHAALQAIPPEGGIKETTKATITVLKLDKKSQKTKLKIELKELLNESRDSDFFIYTRGNFYLAKEFQRENASRTDWKAIEDKPEWHINYQL